MRRTTTTYSQTKIFYTPKNNAKKANNVAASIEKNAQIIIVTLVVSSLLWLLFASGFFSIWSVNFRGISFLKKEELVQHLRQNSFKKLENIFLFDTNNLEKSFKETFPLIDSVTITKKYIPPAKLLISIREIEPYMIWTFDGVSYALDKNCTIRSPFPFEQKNITRITGYEEGLPDGGVTMIGKNVCKSELLNLIKTLEVKIPSLTGHNIKEIKAIDHHDVAFVLDNSIILKFTCDKNILLTLEHIQTIYSAIESGSITAKEYIDFRLEKRVALK